MAANVLHGVFYISLVICIVIFLTIFFYCFPGYFIPIFLYID